MFRVSKLADYGTVVMVYLTHDSHTLHSATEIAQQTHIPQPTVTKILKRLARAGIIHSKLGVQGGYTLAKKPQEILILDILEALDNKLDLIECTTPGTCSLEAFCAAKGNWQLISRTIRQALSQLTLRELAMPELKFALTILPVSANH